MTQCPVWLRIARCAALAGLLCTGLGHAQSSADGPANAAIDLRIHDIQGRGHVSPRAGDAVAGVPGVVTAIADNGVYLQDPDGDGDPATSDAVFVFTRGMPTRRDGTELSVGDAIRVSGTVSEFIPGGADTHNLPTTQIRIGREGAIEALTDPGRLFDRTDVDPTTIGASGRRPPTGVIDDEIQGSVLVPGDGSVFDPDRDGLDFYESLESMRVRIERAVVVSPTTRFGELFVLADGGVDATGVNARGGITLVDRSGGIDYNPERIQIDDGLLPTPAPQVDVGAVFTAVDGVLGYGFGNFEVLPTTLAAPQPSKLMPTPAITPEGGATLSVAGYNVENLDPNDSDGDRDVAHGRFQAIATQIVDDLGRPDIVALQEVQDNDGSRGGAMPADGDTTGLVVAADRTLARLVQAIVDAGGPRYTAIEVVPEPLSDGGQPGGNIRVAYLYNDARVALVDAASGRGNATTATAVSKNAAGRLSLSHNPGRIAPSDPAFENSRKPVAALFEFEGRPLLLINVHLSSKRRSSPLFGALQPPINGSAERRAAQAAVINAFVDDVLASVPDAAVGVVGDFNEFDFLPPMAVLRGEPDDEIVLRDLLDRLDPTARYTYLFEGNSQALDHFYASQALRDATREIRVAHINTEFVEQASDHDAVLARFSWEDQRPDNGGAEQTVDDPAGCTLGNARDPVLLLMLLAAAVRVGCRGRAGKRHAD